MRKSGYITGSNGNAPVAQLDRASASGVEGREFESRRVHHHYQRLTTFPKNPKIGFFTNFSPLKIFFQRKTYHNNNSAARKKSRETIQNKMKKNPRKTVFTDSRRQISLFRRFTGEKLVKNPVNKSQPDFRLLRFQVNPRRIQPENTIRGKKYSDADAPPGHSYRNMEPSPRSTDHARHIR